MRANVGVGVGPVRVSQGIGMPGGGTVGALVVLAVVLPVVGWALTNWRVLLVGYAVYCVLVFVVMGVREVRMHKAEAATTALPVFPPHDYVPTTDSWNRDAHGVPVCGVCTRRKQNPMHGQVAA